MRYAILISYDGSGFSGFQKQNDEKTIQGEIERVLLVVLNEKVSLVGCGRTDSGVSAVDCLCHFDYKEEINFNRFVGYSNSLLPETIRIKNIKMVSDDFHARYSATSKTYEYYFYVGDKTPFYEKFASNIGYNVNIEKMQEACKYFIGEHDFTSFCSSNTSVENKVRTIYNLEIKGVEDNLYKLIIKGNGFLYNMVRIIMGTLVNIGLGKIEPKDVENIILCKDRSKSGKTMPAKGLVLKKVGY